MLGILIGAGGFAAAGAGWAALSGGGGPDLSAGVACQDRANLRSNMTQAFLDGRDAVAICAALWRRGVVRPGSRTPPPLQACVEPAGGGVIRVMPGRSAATCERLGLLARPDVGGSPAQRRYAAFERDVIASVHRGPPRCVPPREGERIVRAVIAEHAMAGWRTEHGPGMRGEGFSAARPCVSIAFDSPRRVVVLVPMVRGQP